MTDAKISISRQRAAVDLAQSMLRRGGPRKADMRQNEFDMQVADLTAAATTLAMLAPIEDEVRALLLRRRGGE